MQMQLSQGMNFLEYSFLLMGMVGEIGGTLPSLDLALGFNIFSEQRNLNLYNLKKENWHLCFYEKH